LLIRQILNERCVTGQQLHHHSIKRNWKNVSEEKGTKVGWKKSHQIRDRKRQTGKKEKGLLVEKHNVNLVKRINTISQKNVKFCSNPKCQMASRRLFLFQTLIRICVLYVN